MVKAIKITPTEVIEIDDWDNYKDASRLGIQGHSIHTPDAWFRRDYTITMGVHNDTDETDGLNKEATAIFNHLCGPSNQRHVYGERPIYGTVFIYNHDGDYEWGVTFLDFDLKDYRCLLDKVNNDD